MRSPSTLKKHTTGYAETLICVHQITWRHVTGRRNLDIVQFGLAMARRLVAGLSPRRPGFSPGSVHVGFVVDKVAPGQGFLRVLRFSPVSFIPPVLH
jgi:hypothetical protein